MGFHGRFQLHLPCQKKRARATAKNRRLVETYGITLADYSALLSSQGNACAICGRTPRYALDVDHDHKTGLIRGLCCKMCNRHLLPAARDSLTTLMAAHVYLEYHESDPVLGGRKVPNA